MAAPFREVINVDVSQSVPDWGPYAQPIAPERSPGVLYIMLNDVGHSTMGQRIAAGHMKTGDRWCARR